MMLLGCGGETPEAVSAPNSFAPAVGSSVAPSAPASADPPADAWTCLCDQSSDDGQRLAALLLEEVVRLRDEVALLRELDPENDVLQPPFQAQLWSAAVQFSRGSTTQEKPDCAPKKLCPSRLVYDPGSYFLQVRAYVDADIHLSSQVVKLPKTIGPLFVNVHVAGAPDVPLHQIEEGVAHALEVVERRYEEACSG